MAGKEVVKGTFGNEPIELNNAATETTLTAMLKLAQKDSAILAQMAKQAGVDSKKIQDSLDKQHGSGSGGSGMGLLGGAANLAGGFLMDMVGSVGTTIKSLANFGESLMEGTARTSDFMKAFSGLPLGLGLLADALAFSAKYFEKNLDTYRAISQTGAGLTSSLGGLRAQALSLGLSLDEFAGMFAKNQDAMSALGAASGQGSKNLVAINQKLMQSNLGTHLMGLGYSFAEINGLIGDYLAVTADGMKVGKNVEAEQKRLAKSAGEYGKELDFLARLTGESREAVQKKMQADAQEASWQAWLLSQGPEQQKAAAQAVERARMLGGKGGVDAIKAMFMGFAGPFSQEGQTFISTMTGGTNALKGMVAAVKNNKDATTAINQIDGLFAKGMASNIKDLEKFRTNIAAMGQGSEGGAKALLDVQEAANKYIKQGMLEEEAIKKGIIAARKKADEDAAAAAGQAKADLAMKELGAKLTTALLPILEKLNKVSQSLVQKFVAFTENKGLMDKLQTAIERLVEYVGQILTKEGRDKIVQDFKDLFAEIIRQLKLAFNPLYGENDAIKERNKELLRARVMEADAKLAAAKEKVLEDEAKLDAFAKAKEDKEALEEGKRQLEKINADKDMSEENKRAARAKIQDSLEEARTRQNLIKNLKEADVKDQLVKDKIRVDNASTMKGIYMNRYDKWKQSGFDYDKATKTENKDDWDYETGRFKREKYANGTIGNGKLIKDFGRERTVDLHGREAVLTEEQLANMARGIQQTASGGNVDIPALNIVAEGIITLNRTTAMQNKILATMVENQRTMINRATGNRLMA